MKNLIGPKELNFFDNNDNKMQNALLFVYMEDIKIIILLLTWGNMLFSAACLMGGAEKWGDRGDLGEMLSVSPLFGRTVSNLMPSLVCILE